jgi:hypothetical protein
MAIFFDSTATSSVFNSSPLSWDHWCSGVQLILIVGIATRNGEGVSPNVTSVTYNGVAMTKAISKDDSTNRTGQVSIWMLANPATGNHTISATFDNDGLHSRVRAIGVSASYTGAQQVSTPDATKSGKSSSSGTKTLTVTTVADNAWIFVAAEDNGSFPSAISSSIEFVRGFTWGTDEGDGTLSAMAGDTNADQTPAGNHNVDYIFTNGFTDGNAYVAASFAPAGNININIADNIAVSEFVQGAASFNDINVFDSIAVSEYIGYQVAIDYVYITENVTLNIITPDYLEASVSDNIQVAETQVNTYSAWPDLISDSAGVSEDVQISQTLTINVEDDISVSDSEVPFRPYLTIDNTSDNFTIPSIIIK